MIKVKLIPYLICITAYIAFICMVSCKSDNAYIYHNLTFQEISEMAKRQNKPFCVVLARNFCPPCESYIEKISEDNSLLSKTVIFNIVNTDLPKNRWYQQWIGVTATPTTCIFNHSGELISVVGGDTNNSFACIGQSILGHTDCAAYTYTPPFFKDSYPELMQSLNDVLHCRNRLECGEDIAKEITLTVESSSYPYSVYLQAINAKNQHKDDQAAVYANRLLSYRDTQYRRLYSGLLLEAMYLINPNYAPSEDVVLSVDKTVKLENCQAKNPRPFSISVSNTGIKDLIIDDILLSCDCISLVGEPFLRLKPGESKSLEFTFQGNYKGTINRSITLFSNDMSNPVTDITISATYTE